MSFIKAGAGAQQGRKNLQGGLAQGENEKLRTEQMAIKPIWLCLSFVLNHTKWA
jgi:hypothetical protein